MEELVTRPIEQAMAAVAGLERLESTSSEGSSRVTLNLAWGTDLNEAADDVRSRLDRVRGRLPEEADAPTVFKFDANTIPDHERGPRGRLRPRQAPRDRRARSVAAARARARRRGGDGAGGPAAADSRRAVEGKNPRAGSSRRPRREPAPDREPEHPARRNRRRRPHLSRAQPGAIREHRRNPRHGRDDPAPACRCT